MVSPELLPADGLGTAWKVFPHVVPRSWPPDFGREVPFWEGIMNMHEVFSSKKMLNEELSRQFEPPGFCILPLYGDGPLTSLELPVLKACAMLAQAGHPVFVAVESSLMVLEGADPSLAKETTGKVIVQAKSILKQAVPNGKFTFLSSLSEIQKASFLDVATACASTRFSGSGPLSYGMGFFAQLTWEMTYRWLHEAMGCRTFLGRQQPKFMILKPPDGIRYLTFKPMPPKNQVVHLSAQQTPVLDFYRCWLNLKDQDSLDILRWTTDISEEELREIELAHSQNPPRRYPHRIVASALTRFVHGAKVAERAIAYNNLLFGGNTIRSLDEDTLAGIAELLPHIKISRPMGMSVVELMTEVGLCASKASAKRMIAQGGVRMNDKPVTEDFPFGSAELLHGKYAFFQRGKKTFRVVIFEELPWPTKSNDS